MDKHYIGGKIIEIFKLIRVEQWIKNTFIFLPLFFNKQFNSLEDVTYCFITFISFSLLASAIYCFNDIYDIKFDKLHPEKNKRPLASGALNKSTAYFVMFFCLFSGFLLAYTLHKDEIAIILLGYVLLNIAYTLVLKNYAIIDLIIVSIGFVLRIFAGGFASNTPLSHWIIIMVFLLAMFLVLAKRRDDLLIYHTKQIKARNNITSYTIEFINSALNITAAVIIVSYIMYTLSPEVIERFSSEYIYVTSLFVIAGILRYLQLTFVDLKSGNPTKVLLRDRYIQLIVSGWILTFFVILYL